eukprot:NODE_1296_length_2025_cov_20.183491_g1097_i0.p1 GENE.NODE_1296_length_2025_cov_20.183491_g1097_i0~~NODE_1296_length_2025_cov_20.183491_g1097_i0.p1  ORF type:complete len:632 (+),score=127.50 NODE_1296_length_2025_cov_20.183491_g1097_i0:88-1983(+)
MIDQLRWIPVILLAVVLILISSYDVLTQPFLIFNVKEQNGQTDITTADIITHTPTIIISNPIKAKQTPPPPTPPTPPLTPSPLPISSPYIPHSSRVLTLQSIQPNGNVDPKTMWGWGVVKNTEYVQLIPHATRYQLPNIASQDNNAPCCSCPSIPPQKQEKKILSVNEEECFKESGTDPNQKKKGVHGYCQPLGPEHYPSPPRKNPPTSNIISSCSLPIGIQMSDKVLEWMESNVMNIFGKPIPSEATLIDYGWRASRVYRLPYILPNTWTFVTATLPDIQDSIAVKRVPLNHIIWAPPTIHRIWSLAASMNFFDYQLILRLEDLSNYTRLNASEILGQLIPMAKHTFIVLPCGLLNTSDFINSAIDSIKQRNYKVGLHDIKLKIKTIKVFTSECGTCYSPLVKVSILQVERGVRHAWCYHRWPFTHKFTLQWKEGDVPFLVNNMPKHLPGGDKRLSHWTPNINLSELLAWGVSAARRLLFQMDMLHYPAASDPASQNWLVSKGGRLIRIDFDNQQQEVIVGKDYMKALGLWTCVAPPEYLSKLCPCCKTCIEWSWDKNVFPPSQCHECYYCSALVLEPEVSIGRGMESPDQFKHCGRENVMATKHYGQLGMPMFCYPYSIDTTKESRQFY